VAALFHLKNGSNLYGCGAIYVEWRWFRALNVTEEEQEEEDKKKEEEAGILIVDCMVLVFKGPHSVRGASSLR
jgi:hypothetical protein